MAIRSLLAIAAIAAHANFAAAQETAQQASPPPVQPSAPAPVIAVPAGPTATPATSVRPIVATPAVSGSVLPAGTPITLRVNTTLSSKHVREGDGFDLTVARDVMMGDFIVIPRGTPGRGEVTWRTGKGAFGKSAKMTIALRSITLAGRTIPLTGEYRIEGSGNTGATVGAAVAVGIFSAFVTGRSAVVPTERDLEARTLEALPVQLPGN